ncbi:MAG: ATP synthase subunit I [Psychromonas sp.]|nr:ATP synthase subunit I [Psychromonas sp.]
MLKERWNKRIFTLFFSQLFILLILASFFYLFAKNENVAFSLFLGGIVYSGPSLLAYFLMGRTTNELPQKIIQKAYFSVFYKIIITIILFIFIYKYIPIAIAFFIVGFLVGYIVQYTLLCFLN